MLAICLVSQFFKNLSVYITGPIINAALILTVLLCRNGMWHYPKHYHTCHIIFHHRKSCYGGYPCDVSMYHDRKYHSRDMCGTASQKNVAKLPVFLYQLQ